MSRLTEFFIGFRNCGQDIKPWGISKIHFIKSEWEEIEQPEVSLLYLIWRGLYALFCVFAVTFSLSISTHPHLWLIFLTRWSLTCQLIYSCMYFIDLLHYKATSSKTKEIRLSPSKGSNGLAETPQDPAAEFEVIDLMIPGQNADKDEKVFSQKNNGAESVVWMLTGIVGTLPIFVTLGYWTLVFPTEPSTTIIPFIGTFFVHGINAIFSLIDTIIIAIPVRVTHFVFLLTFGITYAIFSGLYELAGGPYTSDPDRPYIYEVLNWRQNPTGALKSSILAAPFLIVLYYFVWFLYILRLKLVFCCSSRQDRESCHYLHQYWLHNKQ